MKVSAEELFDDSAERDDKEDKMLKYLLFLLVRDAELGVVESILAKLANQ
jgi:hypothetical protein